MRPGLVLIFFLLHETGVTSRSANQVKTPSKQQEEIYKDDSRGGKLMRTKRNGLQFGLMVHCATGRNPSDYLGYGCYCGLGGQGTPVDDTDRCCFEHDECYNKINREKICSLPTDVYLKFYFRDGCTGCASSWFNSRCRKAICECDGAAAKCFKRNTFNSQYKDYDPSQC